MTVRGRRAAPPNNYFPSTSPFNRGSDEPGPRRKQSGLRIGEQLLARVGDVEVAHRQLADAILRREADSPFSIVSRSGL